MSQVVDLQDQSNGVTATGIVGEAPGSGGASTESMVLGQMASDLALELRISFP